MTCTVGTDNHPILLYFLRTLIARLRMGDPLLPSSPMFIIPLKSDTDLKTSFLPLAYSDIVAADKIRTQKLGLTDIAFRTHLRRRGGASDLYDAGMILDTIKVVGH